MADLTLQVQILGGYPDVDTPLNTHGWSINIPANTVTGAGDTILLPNLFHAGTRVARMDAQVVSFDSAPNPFRASVIMALRANDGGALSSPETLLTDFSLRTTDSELGTLQGSEAATFGVFNNTTHRRVMFLNIDVLVGAPQGSPLILTLNAVMGRFTS